MVGVVIIRLLGQRGERAKRRVQESGSLGCGSRPPPPPVRWSRSIS